MTRSARRRGARLAAFAAACAAAVLPRADAPAASSWRSGLYPLDWTPAATSQDGSYLPDVSFAGYRNGEAVPDEVPGPVVDVVAPHGADPTGASDATAAVQAAIDAASLAGGGVVRFPAGTFRIDGILSVRTSGVVLRGAGREETLLVGTRSASMTDRATVEFSGTVSFGADLPLAADGAERADVVRVADATSLAPGDEVAVGWTITPEFIAEHGMTGTWVSFTGQWKPVFRRRVVATDVTVSPHAVTLDIPLRYPAKMRDGASVRRETGHLREVGCESLSITNATSRADAWAHDRAHAIQMSGVADGWVRDVRSAARPSDAGGDHLQSGGVIVVSSRRVTVERCEMRRAQNRGPGGNGYLFEVSRSGEVLFADCIAEDGRHNFIQNWDYGTTGCVFLRCTSRRGRAYFADWDPVGYVSYSEYHHSLAMANLVDSCVLEDGWSCGNRGSESSGAGHTAARCVFWNLSGGGLLRSHQFGRGLVVGPGDMTVQTQSGLQIGSGTAPEDTVERGPAGATLDPPSLYEDQRRRRLGVSAMTAEVEWVADLRDARGSVDVLARFAPPLSSDPAAAGLAIEVTAEPVPAEAGEAASAGLAIAPDDPGWRPRHGRATWSGAAPDGVRWKIVAAIDGTSVRARGRRLPASAWCGAEPVAPAGDCMPAAADIAVTVSVGAAASSHAAERASSRRARRRVVYADDPTSPL